MLGAIEKNGDPRGEGCMAFHKGTEGRNLPEIEKIKPYCKVEYYEWKSEVCKQSVNYHLLTLSYLWKRAMWLKRLARSPYE